MRSSTTAARATAPRATERSIVGTISTSVLRPARCCEPEWKDRPLADRPDVEVEESHHVASEVEGREAWIVWRVESSDVDDGHPTEAAHHASVGVAVDDEVRAGTQLLCAEVAKLSIRLREPGKVIAFPVAAAIGAGPPSGPDDPGPAARPLDGDASDLGTSLGTGLSAGNEKGADLQQVSASFGWSGRRDLNSRRPPWQLSRRGSDSVEKRMVIASYL